MKVKHLTVDYTGLSTYRSCPRKFSYGYVNRRSPLIPSDALVFGSLIHGALANFYAGGTLGTEAVCEHNFKEFSDFSSQDYRVGHDCARCRALAHFVSEARKTHLADAPAETARSIHHGMNLLWHYFRIYGDPHQQFRPFILPSMKPAIELIQTVKINDLISYRGTIDMVAHELASDRIVGVEHKTTYYLNEAFLNRARLNDQVTGYIFLMQETIHPDIDTIVWNALQTASKKLTSSPGECFARTSTRRSPSQLAEWKDHLLITTQRMIEDIESERFVTSMPDACTAWNSMCAFADVCNAPASERASFLETNYASNPWEGVLIE